MTHIPGQAYTESPTEKIQPQKASSTPLNEYLNSPEAVQAVQGITWGHVLFGVIASIVGGLMTLAVQAVFKTTTGV